MPKAYIIDGNSLLFRAYYATAYGPNPQILRTKEGIPTNAIMAFSNMLNKILQGLKEGDAMFVGFDTGKATFRHKEDEKYKANRKPTPEDLVKQMPIAREMLKALDVPMFELEGYEADDLCGTVAKRLGSNGYEVLVYTSDKDFLQLIDNHITVNLLKTGMSNMVVMNEKTMPETFGFQPKQIVDYKGLRGDSSDNLPGIPGIGDVTAVKLIQEYGSFDKIIEAAPTMKGKLAENLINGAEQGRHCYEMAQILTDVELPFDNEHFVYKGYEFEKVAEFCHKYELKQFLNRLPSNLQKNSSSEVSIDGEEITSLKDVEIGDKLYIYIDREPGNYHLSEVYGLGLFTKGKAYYISKENFNDETLSSVLKDEKVSKATYDYKALMVLLNHLGIEINGLTFDLLLAAYIVDSSLNNDIKAVVQYFGYQLPMPDDAILSLFDNSDKAGTMNVAYAISLIEQKATKELENQAGLDLYRNVELPLTIVLAKMEIEGFPLDVNKLEEFGETFQEQLNLIKKEIYELAGKEFNIDSPKQVGVILYEKLGLKGDKKGSTSVDVLKSLINAHPIVPEILKYRKYAKLLSTYVTGLASHIHADQKIHAIFNQAQTATGRLSSSEPNLQNISIRDEEGKMIRQAFYYKEDGVSILSLDYSQVELRILAHLSHCKKLQEVFESGEDIHAATAKKLFNVDEPSELQRRKAKAVNFGIIYGISDWGLADQVGMSMKDAKLMIERFYETYPEVNHYFRQVVAEVTEKNYVTTLLGRRRYLREVNDTNYQVREFARRAAMNAPIQGTAADLIKVAMIAVDKALTEKKLKTKLILQIHDELLFKVPDDEKDIVYPLIKSIMENALKLDVKLEVDGGYGRTWYDCK